MWKSYIFKTFLTPSLGACNKLEKGEWTSHPLLTSKEWHHSETRIPTHWPNTCCMSTEERHQGTGGDRAEWAREEMMEWESRKGLKGGKGRIDGEKEGNCMKGRDCSMKRNVECTVGYGHIRHGAHVELRGYRETVAVSEMAYCCNTYCTWYGAWEVSFCMKRMCTHFT